MSWTQNELSELFNLSNQYGDNWELISKLMKKSANDCQEIYNLIVNFAMSVYDDEKMNEKTNITEVISQNKPVSDNKKKRSRRKANQIERLYKCLEYHCNRSYGTEGALKMHLKLKHPNVKYNSKYQYQARQAAMSMIAEEDNNNNESQTIDIPEVLKIVAPYPLSYYPEKSLSIGFNTNPIKETGKEQNINNNNQSLYAPIHTKNKILSVYSLIH